MFLITSTISGHPLPQSPWFNIQRDPGGHSGHTRGRCPFIQHGEKVGEFGRQHLSGKASHHHHTGNHCQDSWHHHGRQTSIRALHRHWVGYLLGMHPYSYPQWTSYVQGVSTLGSKAPRTWSEMDLAQHVKGKSWGGSQQFSSEIVDYGSDLSPSLPTRDEATIEAVVTPRFSTSQESQDCDVCRQGDDSIFWDAGVLLVDCLDKGHTIIRVYYADLLRKSSKFSVECSSTRTMLHHVWPQWQWLLSRNVDSNSSNTHHILLIWLLLTTTSFQKLKMSSVVIIFAIDDDVMNAMDHFLRAQKTSVCSMISGLSVSM